MNRAAKQQGFTIIELVLAMAFISALLLAIALTIIQIGTIYNKGMTLKELNQTGRTISDDIRRGISASEAFDKSAKFITNPASGRLCLEGYTYLWNYGIALDKYIDSNLITYADPTMKNRATSNTTDRVRFLKVPDATGIYCAKDVDGKLIYKDVRAADRTTTVNTTTDLLKSGDRTLSVHSFALATSTMPKDPITGQQLYIVSFSIGTSNITALEDDLSSCRPPGDPKSDYNYCAIQQFSLVVRAGNRVN